MKIWLARHFFAIFKYFVYLALAADVGFFFVEEWLAAQHVFQDGLPWLQVIQGFAATIDTAAWVVLLLMFELETYQLSEIRVSASVTSSFMAVRTLCYGLIVYALYGYVLKAFALGEYQLVMISTSCDYIVQGYGMLSAVDEYDVLTTDNCLNLAGLVYLNEAIRALASPTIFEGVVNLARIDVVNAITWILVVIMLELDVWLGVRGRLMKHYEWISWRLKMVLYFVLLVVAGYWGWAGDFLDFWDAFLWILAFVFIERSVFVWEKDKARNSAQGVQA